MAIGRRWGAVRRKELTRRGDRTTLSPTPEAEWWREEAVVV